MAPGIALDILSKSDKQIRVLDPMMGSGTVLAVARSKGHKAIGVDLDPLAVLISRVWTTAVNIGEVRDKAEEVLSKARIRYSSIRASNAYPSLSDDETQNFVSYWFDHFSRRQLTALAQTIEGTRNSKIRDVLWCAFSRLIITKANGASLAMDLSHSRPHKIFEWAPAKAFDNFLPSVDHVLQNCIAHNDETRGPSTCTHLGDARDLPIKSESIDLVLTSPPYLNAIDYMRCSKFSLVWMRSTIGEIRTIRSHSVGAELRSASASDDISVKQVISDLALNPKLDARHEAMLARYVFDMMQSVKETARVLIPGCKAVYVIGENTVRGTFVPNSKLVSAVAESAGLKFSAKYSRKLPENRRYLPPPTSGKNSLGLNSRMRKEVVLTFTK
jgi:DNA modification methylase